MPSEAPHHRDVEGSMPICMPTRDEWSALRSGRFIPVTHWIHWTGVDRNLWPCGKRTHSSSRSLNYLFCTCTVKTEQQRQCAYNVTLRSFRPTIPAEESNEYYTTWVCVFVALGIQHAMCMRHIFICGIPALQYFFTFSHKRHDFIKKLYWTQNMWFDFLYNVCLKHFSF